MGVFAYRAPPILEVEGFQGWLVDSLLRGFRLDAVEVSS